MLPPSFSWVGAEKLPEPFAELMMKAMGPSALSFERESLSATYCNFRKTTIYGGTNEIQRNIISQRLLGL